MPQLTPPRFVAAAGFGVAAALVCLEAPAARALETLDLQPVADTTLFETDPLNNLGGASTLVSGTTSGTLGTAFRSRALLQFDVAGHLPPGAAVISASLHLTVVKVPGFPANSTFELHRVRVGWGEGNKTGNNGLLADTGEATWMSRFTPLPQWVSPGGAAGSDFDPAGSASVAVAGLGAYTFSGSSNLVADVQAWADPTNANFGWMLLSADEATAGTARRFASHEAATNAPLLSIQYLLPPVMAGMTLLGTNVTCHFTIEAGFDYTVEYTDALPATSTNWLVLTNLGAKVDSFEAAITNAVDAVSGRFFRLRRVPCNCR